MKTLLGIIVLLIIFGGGYYFTQQPSPSADTAAVVEDSNIDGDEMSMTEGEKTASDTTEVAMGIDVDGVKTFTVEGGKFYFTPNSMEVKKGDTVRVTFKNVDGFHDFVIDEFNTRTKQIKTDEEDMVEFVADKAGVFEFYCSVGEHRSLGMKGILTVTE